MPSAELAQRVVKVSDRILTGILQTAILTCLHAISTPSIRFLNNALEKKKSSSITDSNKFVILQKLIDIHVSLHTHT